MKKVSIPLSLTTADKAALNFVLNVVRRCQDCRIQLLSSESPQHIRRHCDVLDGLGLNLFEDMPRDEIARMIREGLNADAPKTEHALEFEAARYLLGVLERRVRYSDLSWLLEPITIGLKRTLDVSFFAEDYARMPSKTLILTEDERKYLLAIFQTPNQCLGCQIIQDGPATLTELQHRSRAFRILRLADLLTNNTTEPVGDEFTLEDAVLQSLKELVNSRSLFQGNIHKAVRVLDKIENAKPREVLKAVTGE